MNQIEAMKQALEAMNAMMTHMGMDEDEWNKVTFDQMRKAITSLRQAIAEAEKQEPVAMVVAYQYEDGSHAGHRLEWRGRNEANDFPEGTSFYTHPQPKREADIDLYSLLACNVEAGVFENQVAPILLDNGFGPQVIKEKNT